MEALTIEQITELQKRHNVTSLQDSVNSGQCWLMEGSQGRFASEMLEAGVVMLPDVIRIDYYGNRVPARSMLKAGTKGTLENSQNFWQRVEDLDMEAIIGLTETFGEPQE